MTIKTLNDADKILTQAWNAIREMAENAPDLIIVPETDEDEAHLECPLCGEWVSEVLEMDSDWRANRAYVSDPTFLNFGQGDSEYETLAFACGECEGLVNVQPEIEKDWC